MVDELEEWNAVFKLDTIVIVYLTRPPEGYGYNIRLTKISCPMHISAIYTPSLKVKIDLITYNICTIIPI